MLRILAASALLTGLMTGTALAQDTSLRPTFGTTELRAGFRPDPRTVSLSSGGSIDATQAVGNGCAGFIADAPDYRVNYIAGSMPLIFSVASHADTTLIINGPDGRWYCDDDGGEGTNPSYRFSNPRRGRYDIWVGTYSGAELQSATLHISELRSQ